MTEEEKQRGGRTGCIFDHMADSLVRGDTKREKTQ